MSLEIHYRHHRKNRTNYRFTSRHFQAPESWPCPVLLIRTYYLVGVAAPRLCRMKLQNGQEIKLKV
jgi:hypothetical protein